MADVLRHHLSQHGGTLLLVAGFHYLLLGLTECYTGTLQCARLTLHHLTEQVADALRILLRGIQPFLLGDEVVHGGHQYSEGVFLLQECRYLLHSCQLYLVADNTEFLLLAG